MYKVVLQGNVYVSEYKILTVYSINMKINYNDENHLPQAYFLFVNILLNL